MTIRETLPLMSPREIELLASHLKPTDHVWEWGSGGSTVWLSKRCKYVTTVEHQWGYAMLAIEQAAKNNSVLYIPPDREYQEGTVDDGDHNTFRHYVEAYSGRSIDAILIDGRARIACARWVAECSTFGPSPGTRVFLHDCQREGLDVIWKDDPVGGIPPWFREVERVERLIVMAPRMDPF